MKFRRNPRRRRPHRPRARRPDGRAGTPRRAGVEGLSEQEQQVLASRGQGAPDMTPSRRRAWSRPIRLRLDAAALGAGGGIAIATLAGLGLGAAGQRRVRTVR